MRRRDFLLFTGLICLFNFLNLHNVFAQPTPIAHWKLDELSGATTAVDNVGNNNGTIVGATPGSVGQVGDAYDFDGSNDYMRTSNVVNPGTNDFTIALWLKPQAVNLENGSYRIVLQQKDSGGIGRSIIYIKNYDSRLKSYLGGSERDSGHTLQLDTWVHVALVHDNDANELKWFVDGELKNTNTGVNAESSVGDYLWGVHKPLNKGRYDGLMDDIQVFSQALTLDQIQDIYLGDPVPPDPPEPPPVEPPTNEEMTFNFDQDEEGFVYQDDAFRSTNQPNYASGNYIASGGLSGGALRVYLGGINGAHIRDMSGAWQKTISLEQATEVSITFQCYLRQANGLEPDEYGQILFSVDGNLMGLNGEDYIAQITGNGNGGPEQTIGWQEVSFDLGELAAGDHTLSFGGFNNKKTWNTEWNEILIDDVVITIGSVPATLIVKNVDYNPSGQIDRIEYGNDVTTEYDYDSALRLQRIYTWHPVEGILQDLNYTYDAVGNVVEIFDFAPEGSDTQSFSYDHLNRLIQATGQYGTKDYVYDKIGNIMEKDGLIYHYDSTGNAGPHALTSLSDGTSFNYDANGNMISMFKPSTGVTTSYMYDIENRLVEVQENGDVIEQYVYDGDGGRVKCMTYENSTMTTTTFVGSLYETDNQRNAQFVFIGSQRVATFTNGQLFFYHANHLGSAHVLTDVNGLVKERTEYEPFGQIARRDRYGNQTQEIAHYYFTGQREDTRTGLHYFGARYYNPELGRFLSADDLIQNPTNPQTLNRYAYTSNNPINRIDANGHFWKSLWKGVKKFFKKFGDFISPLGRAIVTGEWKNFGWQMLNIAGIAFAPNMFLRTSAALGYTSRAVGNIGGRTANQISRGIGIAGFATAAGYAAWNVGVGIKNWIHDPGARLIFPDGSTGNAEDLDRFGKVLVPGVNTGEEAAQQVANFYDAPVFNNPSHGVIADFTEAFLQKFTGTGSVDRQFAGLLAQTSNPIHIVPHSQGTIITANALTQLGVSGNRLASGSEVSFMAAAISQPRAYITAALGGAKGVYNTRAFDPINLVGPNVNPLKLVTGAAGGLTQGAKQHKLELYGY